MSSSSSCDYVVSPSPSTSRTAYAGSRYPLQEAIASPRTDFPHPTDINRNDSAGSDTKEPVRLLGRGGQGSRPRKLRTVEDLAPVLHHDPLAEFNAAQKSDAARIVGRGGMGSRPRGLSTQAVERVALPQPPPQPPAPPVPVSYRPAGRGGAGSRPRVAKPASEINPADKSPMWLWKGNGKGKGRDLGSSSGLTRGDPTAVDTIAIASSPAVGAVQHLYAPNPLPQIPRPVYSSTSTSSLGNVAHSPQPRTTRFQRLVQKTLGFDARLIAAVPVAHPANESTRSAKTGRRSSVSGFASPPGLDEATTRSIPIAAKFLRRRSSSYESVPSNQNTHVDPSNSYAEENTSTVHDHRNAAHMQLTGHSNDPLPSQPQYPRPPPPPQAFPDEPQYYEDDSQSEISTYDGSTDESSDLRTISSASTSHPPLLESDTEDESECDWGRSPTPTPAAMAASDRADTPFSSNGKHLSVPFQNAPLIVSPTWEPADPLAAVIRHESEQGWSGEWNRRDIGDVIGALRELRL
ncbi:hypothetical protein C8R44DRAFT_194365 [Mycena epipterygia]|nr:hypothetical protein C8R44DRAFT_194365 [Mycena epipterygia]